MNTISGLPFSRYPNTVNISDTRFSHLDEVTLQIPGFLDVCKTLTKLKQKCKNNKQEIRQLTKENKKLYKMIEKLWYAPGGPGYDDALNNWNNKINETNV